MKPGREPAPSRPQPSASLKKPHESCPSAALLVGPRRKKTDRGQRSAFTSETSRFARCILVSRRGFSHPTPRGPAHLPFPERIWCLTHRLLSFLPLSAAVRQFWCHDRWYERPGSWIQLAVHTANGIGYYAVSWSQHAWTPYRLLTSTVWVHPGREAARGRASSRPVSSVVISMGQPGKVANPARRQLNRENETFPCPRSRLTIWSHRETGMPPSRPASAFSIWCSLTRFLSLSAMAPISSCRQQQWGQARVY